jgi:hypothetical protein
MSLVTKRPYFATGRYDKTPRRQKIYGLCGSCGNYGFSVCCKIRSKNSSSQDIPLGLKYCTTCKCITVLDSKLKIVNKAGKELL